MVVVGGGPAGCAAASLLASHGHDVVLVTRPTPPATWLAESIPASARKLLAQVGALEAVEGAGFLPNQGNTVWWAGRAPRSERFPEGQSGFHADRGGLEATFLRLAREAGVEVRLDGPVRGVEEERDGWRVETTDTSYRGRWLLDASGRSGVLARRDLRIRERQSATLALVGHYEIASSGDATLTLIESYEDGWAWSVPLSDTLRCVTAMVDPRRTGLRREKGLDGMLRGELFKAQGLTERLGPGRMVGSTRVCPATLYGAHRFGRTAALLVGDAGSFIDPLSSYGVKKALASAWLAAITTHTGLTDDAMAETAIEFFDAREKEVYDTYRARSITFLEEAADAHGHAFWDVRLEAARTAEGRGAAASAGPYSAAAADEVSSGRVLADREAEAYLGAPAVRVAYEEIRGRPSVDLRRGTTLRTIERPAIVGDRIALEPHLTSAALPGGARYVCNVDLRRLLRAATGRSQVPDIYEAYNSGGRADLSDFLAALALAVGAGFLDLADGEEPSPARGP